MKILIHALGADTGGGRRHIESFVPALSELNPSNNYTVLARDGVLADIQSPNVCIRHIPIDQSSTGLKRFLFDQVELPRILRTENFEVCVSILNFGPFFCRSKHVIFQRNALYFDTAYRASESFGRRLGNSLRKMLASLSIRNADMVVSPSEAMNNFILASSVCRKSKARFEVLYHGFDSSLLPQLTHSGLAKLAEKEISIFYPSHFARHKGFAVLFDAAKILVAKGLNCRISVTVDEGYWADGLDWFQEQISLPELGGSVVNLGQVPQSEIWREYQNADIVFFPSQCESFGFPLLESLAAGKPIVASDIKVNTEICGDAASFFENDAAEDAAAKLASMFESRERDKYSKLATARFKERDWSWGAYAARFDEMVSGLSDHSPGSAAEG